MNRLLSILKAIVTYRTILFPATLSLAWAIIHAMHWKVDATEIINALFGFLTAVATVWGIVLDSNNAAVKQALTTQAKAVNAHADELNELNPGTVSAKVPSPPAPPVDPETPKP